MNNLFTISRLNFTQKSIDSISDKTLTSRNGVVLESQEIELNIDCGDTPIELFKILNSDGFSEAINKGAHQLFDFIRNHGRDIISCKYIRPSFNSPETQDMIDNFDVSKIDISNECEGSRNHFKENFSKIDHKNTETLTPLVDGIAIIITKDKPRRRINVQRVIEWLHIQDRVVLVDSVWYTENPHRGCLRSHQVCAQIAEDRGWKNVVVFEDDVMFYSDAFDNVDMSMEVDVDDAIRIINSAIEFSIESDQVDLLALGGCVIPCLTRDVMKFIDPNECVVPIPGFTTSHAYFMGSKLISIIANLPEHMIIDQYLFESFSHMSCSFGVATYKKDRSVDVLLKRADIALYRAKDQGRNQVCTNNC